MCGFAGFIESGGGAREVLTARALLMVHPLRHRGPDRQGVWVDSAVGLGLGFQRLCIVDLSPAGDQPMLSASGRYVLVYNGEIYNFRELRLELEQNVPPVSETFRGHSDTEVMLAAFDHWGVRDAVRQFNGMFAFALWDRQNRKLFLGRDRLGQKPIYYTWTGKSFLFGSELKALRMHPDFRAEIDRDALSLYARLNCVPSPFSIYRGVYKLPPACLVEVDIISTQRARPEPYWSLRAVAERGLQVPFADGIEEATEELDSLLRQTVKSHMVADVPLGVFLSGGIDSSLVTALMQSQSSRPVRTFSIGFHEEEYDEAAHARLIARHLQTDHTEFLVTPTQALEAVPNLPDLYDEPFSDSSQIPTFLLARLARQYVTVALTGDGGDEVFGGYNRYLWYSRIWNLLSWVPKSIRGASVPLITGISPQSWQRIYGLLAPLLPRSFNVRLAGEKMHKLSGVLGADSPEDMYSRLTSSWAEPQNLVLGSTEPVTRRNRREEWPPLAGFVQQVMYLDTVNYLPDDILTKVDRATMGVSLESRAPYLDHNVVEFAWSLPAPMKIQGRTGKWLLRRVLNRYVPESIYDRPKMGFAIPLDQWLRGELRDWAEPLLTPKRISGDGYFDPEPITQKWQEHLSGRRNWQSQLWNVLMFQAWLDNNRSCAGSSESEISHPILASRSR